MQVFISYRRDDSQTIVGRIFDYLEKEFGEGNIFRDVDSILAGADFPTVVKGALESSDAILVIIGQKWLSPKNRKRLHDPDDFLRIEIETALVLPDKLLIPVLVNGAKMPLNDKLPQSLHSLTVKNASPVRDDPDFRRDMERLILQIKNQLGWKIVETVETVPLVWTAAFFPDTDLRGTPIPVGGIREINFDWGNNGPVINDVAVPGIGTDNLSIRFTATQNLPEGNYQIQSSSKDGIRTYVDGALVLDQFVGRHFTVDPPIRQKLANGHHNFTVKYFHGIAEAVLSVQLQRIVSSYR